MESDVNVDVCPSKYRHDDVIRGTGAHDLRRHYNVSAAHGTRQDDDHKRLRHVIFTALRAMQTRYCDENSVRLSVRHTRAL